MVIVMSSSISQDIDQVLEEEEALQIEDKLQQQV